MKYTHNMLHSRRLLLLGLMLLLWGSIARAQLAGGSTYQINGTSSAPLSFATIAEAFTYLNTNGTTGSGAITLEINTGYPGESTAIPALNAYPGMSADKPITLRPAPGTSHIIRGNPANLNAVIRFNGAKYFTIDGSGYGTHTQDLTIKSQSTTNTTAVVALTPTASSSCTGIAVKNCIITGYSTNSSLVTNFGIYLGSSTTYPDNALKASNDSNTFSYNLIQGVRTGIYLRGSSTALQFNNAITIQGNTIGGTVAPGGAATDSTTYIGGGAANQAGIFISTCNNVLIDSNTIRNHLDATNYGFSGIQASTVANYSTNVTITRNRIYDLTYTGSGAWGEYGMRLTMGSANLFNFYVYNNLIWNIRADGYNSPASTFNPCGIMLEGTSTNAGIYLFNNSINMYGTGLNAGASAGLWVASGLTGGIAAVNNIFSNSLGGNASAGVHAVTVNASSGTPFSTINNNTYYANAAVGINRVGYIKGAGVTTLAAWKNSTTGTGQDAASYFRDPAFPAPNNLVYTSGLIAGEGQPIVMPTFPLNITTDILGNTRNAAYPTPGAVEIPLTSMVYDSSNSDQITTITGVGFINQEILRIKVSVTGKLSPLNLSKLSFNTGGSTNAGGDIDTAKIFFTGSSNVFSTTNQYGSNLVRPNGVMYFNGSQQLTTGDNYFWLTYSIRPTATALNQVDAVFDSLTLNGSSINTPTNGNPAGARTIMAPLNGNYTIGAGQNYQTLTQAVNDLNTLGVSGPVTFTLTDPSYTASSGEVFPITFRAYQNASATNTVTLMPGSSMTSSITGNNATSIFTFDGASRIIVNGRQGGTGTPKNLTIENTNTAGNTIRFINDANNIAFRNDSIKGNNTVAAGGVVTFLTGIVTGNDYITIDSCNIGDGGSGTPATAINSSGSTTSIGIMNSNNIISNCNIYNFWHASSEFNAFKISNGSTDWILTGNSLYQTAARATSVVHYSFNFQNSGNMNALNNIQITNNYIGGSAPQCGGTPWTQSSSAGQFCSYMNLGNLSMSRMSNNTWANFNIISTSTATGVPGAWNAVQYINGLLQIDSNTIGNLTDTSSITIATGASAIIYPIATTASSTAGTFSISGNKFGSISVGANAGSAGSLYLIHVASATNTITYNITNNVIGGDIANSIKGNATSGTGAQSLIGINNSSSANLKIRNNIIRNLSNFATGSGTNLIHGIVSTSGTDTLTGNMIYNLTSSSPSQVNNTGSSSLTGIRFTSTGSTNLISQNQIFGLNQINTGTGTLTAIGINLNGLTGSLITRNLIHSLSVSSTSATSNTDGILVQGGTTNRITNNLIRLGLDSNGNSLTQSILINGINKTGGNIAAFFNTIYIGGSVTGTGVVHTGAFTRTTAGTDSLENNILVNVRTNTSTGGDHSTLFLSNNTTLVSNKNILYGTVIGRVNSVSYPTLSLYRNGTTLDGASAASDPNLTSPAGPASGMNFHLNNPTPAEGAGILIPGINEDFDGQSRNSLTPTDIGADAGNYTPADVFPPVISFTPLVNTAITANRTVTATISDPSGVYLTGSNTPKIHFKKFASGTYQYTDGVLVSGTKFSGTWEFTINNSLIGGVTSLDSVYYFVVAMDSTTAGNLGSFPAGADGSGTSTLFNYPSASNYKILQSLSGTLMVGAGQTYPTLTGAGGIFEAINSSALTGDLTVLVTSDITEPGTNALNPITYSGAPSYQVVITPDAATERVLAGSVSTSGSGLIRISGARNVKFDGRYSGSGRYLRFRNRAQAGTTFQFINDARVDSLMYCYVEGINNTTGTILFGGTNVTSGTGNDSNVVAYCVIRDTLSTPTAGNVQNTGISSSGNSTYPNDYNQILNNEIFNFGYNAINMNSGGTGNGWVISGNSFYQTVARSNSMNVVLVSGGYGHTITNNSLGGSAADRSGAPFTTTSTSTTTAFSGFSISVGTTIPTVLSNNIVSNLIATTNASLNIFNISAGTVTISNNTIGGRMMPYDTVQNGYDNGAINVSGGTVSITGNLISDISYIRSAGDRNSGITVSGGTATITDNIIRRITSNSTSTGFTYLPMGIFLSGGTGHIVRNNRIDSIVSTNTGTSAYTSIGINIGGASSVTVSQNRITRVSAIGTGTGSSSPYCIGMYVSSTGNVNASNNQISVGSNANGEQKVIGIQDVAGSGNNNYFYNSVYVSGAQTGSNNSYCLQRTSTSNTVALNNIFYNGRTGGTGTHFATGSNSLTGVTPATTNYNLLVTADTAKVAEAPSTYANSVSSFNSLYSGAGTYSSNLYEITSNLPATSLFANPSNGVLNVLASNPESWYVNGKGLPLAGYNQDFANATTVRSVSIATGATDLGSTEITTTTTPPLAVASGSIAAGTTTTYYFANRPIASITWGSAGTLPASVDVLYYSGIEAPSLIAGKARFNSYYSVTPNGGSGYTYSIKLAYDTANLGTVPNVSASRLARLKNGNWFFINTSTVTPLTGFVGSAQSFGDTTLAAIFTGTDVNNALPVEWLSFTGHKENLDARLKWTTASEINNREFIVERSSNGKDFSVAGRVKGSGNSSKAVTYTFTDRQVFNGYSGNWYYRITQVDLNGKESSSGTIILYGDQLATTLSVYPNPFADACNLNIVSETSENVTIEITDLLGNLVKTINTNVVNGSNLVHLNGQEFNPGLYIVSVKYASGNVQTIKIMH